MSITSQYRTVETVERLREIVNAPAPDAMSIRKQRASLDEHCRAFIAASPFCLLATASSSGRCDVSPRGDAPGFALVLDERTIAIPERPGNRRIDSLLNIIDNPHAGLLFLVPGKDETLRVNGRAAIVEDDGLLARMRAQGKSPQVGIMIETEEVFFHCARAFRRSRLWQQESWPESGALATFGTVLADQIRPDNMTASEIDCYLEEANRKLY
jgi:uncharacterized protein